MAKETFTKLTDDLDGSEATEELTFALRGVQYEIDLNAKNVAALEKALDKFIAAGRRVSHGRAPRTGTRRSAGARKEDLSAIRDWARENGHEVSSRGRIAREVREAYDAAP